MLYIAYLEEHEINLAELENFLISLYESDKDILSNFDNTAKKTNLRRLIRMYDYLKYGKKENNSG